MQSRADEARAKRRSGSSVPSSRSGEQLPLAGNAAKPNRAARAERDGRGQAASPPVHADDSLGDGRPPDQLPAATGVHSQRGALNGRRRIDWPMPRPLSTTSMALSTSPRVSLDMESPLLLGWPRRGSRRAFGAAPSWLTRACAWSLTVGWQLRGGGGWCLPQQEGSDEGVAHLVTSCRGWWWWRCSVFGTGAGSGHTRGQAPLTPPPDHWAR